MFLVASLAMKIRMASNLATGANDSLKSISFSLYSVRAKEMEVWDPFICNDSYESESSDDEEDAEDDEDPFYLYDILNKRKDSGDDLKYPPGFTPSGINVEEEAKMESIKLVTIKTLWGNSSFDYALSSSLGNSRGVLCVWEPTLFTKDNVTSYDNFLAVMGTWVLSSSKLLINSVYAP
ncbi:hypothetical protein Tco_0859852 [Tanacetum coccineum]|uniref:RNA-directed DNA polymerase, eukaryota n=1 Tax=Tanacetum coccineum TaxID=301880 RepID=A0ABQ5BD80_9ASTR